MNNAEAPTLRNEAAPLSEPHLSKSEIQRWVLDKVTSALNFDDTTYSSNLNMLTPYMSDDATQQFVNFLGSQGIYEQVVNKSQSIRAISSATPSLTYWDRTCRDQMSEFIKAGRYYWRFDIPVVYAISSKNTRNLSNVAARSGRQVTVRILVSRAGRDVNDDGLVIRGWALADPC